MTKKTALSETAIIELINKINTSRKYRELHIPEETVRDLILHAQQVDSSPSLVEKTVRQKMHNLVAPYLGDLDYEKFQEELGDKSKFSDPVKMIKFCSEVLNSHASTRERFPFLSDFYEQLFAITGMPGTILDLACGLNPFAIPWMELSPGTRYYAFDLHLPRVNLVNAFFKQIQQPGAAVHGDILVSIPQVQADVVFFFKEAHRFDQRQHGCNRLFFQSLKTRYLLVSLPTVSLTGRHSKLDQDHRLIDHAVSGTNWNVKEIIVGNEIVFCIKKDV